MAHKASARLFWGLGLLALVSGCGFDPEGDAPMSPPALYREWWAKTEACSGRTGNFERLRWSVIEGHSFPCSSGECAGHWRTDHHIYLAGDWVMDEMVVRHEMLHDLPRSASAAHSRGKAGTVEPQISMSHAVEPAKSIRRLCG